MFPEFIANRECGTVLGGQNDDGKPQSWVDIEARAHSGGSADVANDFDSIDFLGGQPGAAREFERSEIFVEEFTFLQRARESKQVFNRGPSAADGVQSAGVAV